MKERQKKIDSRKDKEGRRKVVGSTSVCDWIYVR